MKCMQKMNVIAKISCYLERSVVTLTPDKILNSVVYRTPFYVNIYGSYKLSKTVRFLADPVDRVTKPNFAASGGPNE